MIFREAEMIGRIDAADDDFALHAFLNHLAGCAVLEVGQQPQDFCLPLRLNLATLVAQALAQQNPERGGVD